MDTVEVVKTVINKALGIKLDQMNPTTNLKANLGMDSTELVEVAIALEKQLGIKIPKGTLNVNHSIAQVAESLDKLKK